MKAYEARRLVYTANQKLKGIKELDKRIEETCLNGQFKVSVLVCWDWGSISDLKLHYEQQGFKVNTSYKQTGPNDSDDYINISWVEE